MVQDNAMMPATVETAKRWKERWSLEFDVLYDTNYVWSDVSLIDRWESNPMYGMVAFPWAIYIHTANMRVWDMYGGFAGPTDYEGWWFQQQADLLEYCAYESGVWTEE